MKQYIIRFDGSIIINADNVDDAESKLNDFILSFGKEFDSYEPIIEFDRINEDEEV